MRPPDLSLKLNPYFAVLFVVGIYIEPLKNTSNISSVIPMFIVNSYFSQSLSNLLDHVTPQSFPHSSSSLAMRLATVLARITGHEVISFTSFFICDVWPVLEA